MLTRLCIAVAVATLAASASAAAHECRADELRFTFTACNAKGRTSAVAYFNQSCAETAAVPLPAPVDAPCVVSCNSGSWYSPATRGCVLCQQGEASNSGGRVVNDFSEFPADFTTYCSPQPCAPWAPSSLGGMMTSGAQERKSGADEAVTSTLTTLVPVINTASGGRVFFQYRVESEQNYDGLQVLVNGSLVVPDADDVAVPVAAKEGSGDKAFILSGYHTRWRRLKVELPVGVSEVKFVYRKDHDQSSLDEAGEAGADRAFIRDIIIEGVQWFAPACTPCAAGRMAPNRGEHVCVPCPRDHASAVGAADCTACKSTEWAPPGSVRCFTKQPCTADDYVGDFGNCGADGKRTRTPRLMRDRHCALTPAAAALAQPSQVPCSSCLPGFSFYGAVCKPCPLRQAYRQPQACIFCGDGTAAVPTLWFKNGFDSFDGVLSSEYFKTACQGECNACGDDIATCAAPDSGFTIRTHKHDGVVYHAIASDTNNGARYESRLEFDFATEGAGRVELQYFFQHTAQGRVVVSEDLSVSVAVDAVETALPVATIGVGRAHRTVAAAGQHRLVITVTQDADRPPADAVSFMLMGLKIDGDTRGSALLCTRCPAGTACPKQSMAFTPCQPGYYSAAQAAECQKCPSGTIAPKAGSAACTGCALGTAPNAAGTECENRCQVALGGKDYDLAAFHGKTFGPIYKGEWISPSEAAQLRADDAQISRLYVSVCDNIGEAGTANPCPLRYGAKVADGHACERLDGNRSYSLGAKPTYALTASGQLSLAFTGGDRCGRGGMLRSTNVTLICDPTEPAGKLVFTGEATHCHYTFSLASVHACKLCAKDSYTKVTGECRKNAQQETVYVKKPGWADCMGGVTQPFPDNNWTCNRCTSADFMTGNTWTNCEGGEQRLVAKETNDNNCVDDGTARDEAMKLLEAHGTKTVRRCNTVDARFGGNSFTVTIVGVILIVLLLAVLALVAVTRHKTLEQQYAQLGSADDVIEMDVEGDDRPTVDHHDMEFDDSVNDVLPAVAAAAQQKEQDGAAADVEPMPTFDEDVK
jgi:hypothetical protein